MTTLELLSSAAAELEPLIELHSPDRTGLCLGCQATGLIIEHPCEDRQGLDRAYDHVMRRQAAERGK